MFLQRKFNQLLIINLTGFLSVVIGQINPIEKPQSPNSIKSMDNDRAYDLHQYLLKNKADFNNHLLLMAHPEYYAILDEIINNMDEIIAYNISQPVIDKLKLKVIGLTYEELHFINYNQLRLQIKNRIIQNKINSLSKNPIEK